MIAVRVVLRAVPPLPNHVLPQSIQNTLPKYDTISRTDSSITMHVDRNIKISPIGHGSVSAQLAYTHTHTPKLLVVVGPACLRISATGPEV